MDEAPPPGSADRPTSPNSSVQKYERTNLSSLLGGRAAAYELEEYCTVEGTRSGGPGPLGPLLVLLLLLALPHRHRGLDQQVQALELVLVLGLLRRLGLWGLLAARTRPELRLGRRPLRASGVRSAIYNEE